MNIKIISTILLLYTFTFAIAQERELLASYNKETKLSPAANLSPQEIEMIINKINPYTLYRKGSIAEYAFEEDGKQREFFGATYVQEIVADEKIEDGLLVAYINQVYLNKKHEPLKGVYKSASSILYPTAIDTAGTYYLTHNIYEDTRSISKRHGFAMAIPQNMQQGDNIRCNSIIDLCKNAFGNNGIKVTNKYHDFVVEKTDTLTTPAGTFECVKLTGCVDGKVGSTKYLDHYKLWLARGIGLVRLEIQTDSDKRKKKSPFIIIYLNNLELK